MTGVQTCALPIYPDGDVLTYNWIAPEGILLSSSSMAKPTFFVPEVIQDTQFIFSLIVNDGFVDSQPDTIIINVLYMNEPPVANAGNNQIVANGSMVILDGTGSFDPDGDELFYYWETPDCIELCSKFAIQPTFTAPNIDSDTVYIFSLIVNDGKVDSEPEIGRAHV